MVGIPRVMVFSAVNPLHDGKAVDVPSWAHDNKTLWDELGLVLGLCLAGGIVAIDSIASVVWLDLAHSSTTRTIKPVGKSDGGYISAACTFVGRRCK